MVLLSSWLRAIRIRFLLASVIAVSNGLAIAYWKSGTIDPLYAGLTYAGVACLHASVDLLNDYWDHKRGIDSATTRTKFSGGTGVLPENVLTPKAVYTAGVMFLILGGAVGAYFVAVRGVTIAAILGFAVVAIYFYSTSIVNSGLGELFVAIKGAMIVLGTFFVQTGLIDPAAIFVGVIVGLLSATVLFVNSFPDFDADKSKGRRTLVILMGKQKAVQAFPIFIIAAYALIVAGIFLGFTKVYSLASFASLPFAIKAISAVRKNPASAQEFVPAMSSAVTYSRITGFVLAVSLLF
ncbi:1,4-dihydroxy-2-naphthoate octaprenyltransferase [Candidatus Nitrososphaera evergladensis SR1]|uniref:1,4-dihydroxy-2-naphthoate octaprenyltransferase n=1 Tax=Candidatus Nitrososphaera evergladensis SR1 TaxID=1459636 RepID=A0A075MR48_9ARCH|nr:1,4-dihydroxy-2-naphthoate octaprenyltransferase [Candidatus Nitrososphaera evergladensis SR1]